MLKRLFITFLKAANILQFLMTNGKRFQHWGVCYCTTTFKFYYFSTFLCISRFRRQHEQLRQVIVRVLRPVAPAKANSPSAEDKDKSSEMGLDAADANAIEVWFIIFDLILICFILLSAVFCFKVLDICCIKYVSHAHSYGPLTSVNC